MSPASSAECPTHSLKPSTRTTARHRQTLYANWIKLSESERAEYCDFIDRRFGPSRDRRCEIAASRLGQMG